MSLDLSEIFFKKKINSFVFLRKKLASADIVSALLYQYHKLSDSNFTYIVKEKKTFYEIKNNEVIYNLFEQSGRLKYFHYNKLSTKIFLIFLIYYNLIFKSNFYIITTYDNTFFYSHFFVNSFFKKKIFYVDVWFVDLPENLKTLFFDQNRDISIKSKFNNNYFIFSKNRKVNRHKNYVLKNPYLNKDMQKIYKDFFIKKNFYNKEKKYIFYALRNLGKDDMMASPDSNLKLFRSTLRILNQIEDDIVVLLKPHFITDEKILKKELASLDKSKFKITYLHPMSLIPFSKIFISNFYTLTMNFAKIYNIPIIEFSDYSNRTKKLILNQPIDPTNVNYYFEINQQNEFQKKIISLLKNNL